MLVKSQGLDGGILPSEVAGMGDPHFPGRLFVLLPESFDFFGKIGRIGSFKISGQFMADFMEHWDIGSKDRRAAGQGIEQREAEALCQ